MRTPSSTFVEQAPEKREHGNVHHNVPESRCGSSKDHNLSYVAIDRHNQFHQCWGSNALPTDLLRYVAIHSIGLPKRTLRFDASQVRKILEMTRSHDWGNYYEHDTVISGANPEMILRSLQNARTTILFLRQERVWVQTSISAIREEGTQFPANSHLLLENCMEFFDARSPGEALEGFLTEKFHHELSWCKAMRYHFRERYVNVVRQSEGTPTRERKEYIHPLLEHNTALGKYETRIAGNLHALRRDLSRAINLLDLDRANPAKS